MQQHATALWPAATVFYDHAVEEAQQFNLAWQLIKQYATVAGAPDGEDSAGRQKMALQDVETAVTRAFDIAERFLAEGERRGYIRARTMTDEDIATARGRIAALQQDAQWDHSESVREVRSRRKREDSTATAD